MLWWSRSANRRIEMKSLSNWANPTGTRVGSVGTGACWIS